MLYNLNRSAPSKRTRLQSVLYNLHRSASSKSTRSERKQQLDVLPVQSSDVKDLLRWPAGSALLSSTRLDLFCGALHCFALLGIASLRLSCLSLPRFAVHIFASCFALLCFGLHCVPLDSVALPCLLSYHFAQSASVWFGMCCFACFALLCCAVICGALLASEDSPGRFLENRPGYLANPVSLRSLVSLRSVVDHLALEGSLGHQRCEMPLLGGCRPSDVPLQISCWPKPCNS